MNKIQLTVTMDLREAYVLFRALDHFSQTKDMIASPLQKDRAKILKDRIWNLIEPEKKG